MLHEQTTEILARLILDLTQTLARSVTLGCSCQAGSSGGVSANS